MYSIVMDDPEITTILYYCFYMIPYFPMVIFWVRILPLSKTEPGPRSDLLLFTLNLLYRYYNLELWSIKRERKSWFIGFLYLGVNNKTGTEKNWIRTHETNGSERFQHLHSDADPTRIPGSVALPVT